jgi:putative addiction module component (TIGR02574 family)
MTANANYDDVLRSARLLSESDWIQLVDELLTSFDPTDAVPLHDNWLAEIDRRSTELDSGTQQSIAWDEVRRRARERAKLNS